MRSCNRFLRCLTCSARSFQRGISVSLYLVSFARQTASQCWKWYSFASKIRIWRLWPCRSFVSLEGERRTRCSLPTGRLSTQAFLTPVPPLTSELSPRPIAPLTEVRRGRQAYVAALKEVMQSPDGNYAEGFTLPGQSRPPTPVPRQGAFEQNNPLSLDEHV